MHAEYEPEFARKPQSKRRLSRKSASAPSILFHYFYCPPKDLSVISLYERASSPPTCSSPYLAERRSPLEELSLLHSVAYSFDPLFPDNKFDRRR